MTAAPSRKCGRPAAAESEQRLQHIVDTALRLFLDHGYGATSLEGIAAAAGVAKTTIYRHFGSKKVLFEKSVELATRGFSVQLAEMHGRGDSAEDGLRHIARCLLEVIYRPGSVSLMRLLFAESPRFPELGRVYGTHAKSIFMTEMVGFLDRCVTAERMKVPDIPHAADQFHHMVMSSRYFDVLLDVAPVPNGDERERIADDAVGLFLACYAA